MRQKSPIDKLVALVIGIIIWAVFIPVVYEIIMLAIEEAPEMKEMYYLLFGAYVGFPLGAIIVYIMSVLSRPSRLRGRRFLFLNSPIAALAARAPYANLHKVMRL